MAAMTTVLTEFSDNGNSRTYTLPTHTAVKPALCIQKRKIPSGNQTILEDTVSVVIGTVDANSVPLPQRASMTVTLRRPIDGASADVQTAYSTLADIIFGDEFANTVNTQEFIS